MDRRNFCEKSQQGFGDINTLEEKKMKSKEDLDNKKKKQSAIDFSIFIGMWEGRDITQELLREQAWKLQPSINNIR